jgi:hypothetical protein
MQLVLLNFIYTNKSQKELMQLVFFAQLLELHGIENK